MTLTRLLSRTLTMTVLLTPVLATTGVNFIPKNSFYSTYAMWALSFSIDLTPYYDNLDEINNTVSIMRTTVNDEIDIAIRNYKGLRRSNDSLFSKEIVTDLRFARRKLLKSIDASELTTRTRQNRLYETLDNIYDLYTHDSDSRQKRSLLPWGGDLLSSLFGTATKTDMNRLRDQLNSLSQNNEELVHIVQDSLTIVNKTNSMLNTNRDAINMLTTATEQLDNKIRLIHESTLSRQLIMQLKLSLTDRINHMSEAIDTALIRLSFHVDKLSINLEKAIRGQISTSLIPSNKMRNILIDISRHIPSSLTLKPYNGNSISWYYKHLPLTIVPDENKIHLVTVIPLIPVESLFTLYNVIAMPIPIESSNKSSQIILESKHFAVSKNGNSYVILDNDDLAKCARTDTTYCPLNKASMNLARMPTCVSSLYLGDPIAIIKYCPVRITDMTIFPIFQHLIEGKWIISTNQKIIIRPRCDSDQELDVINVTPPVQVVTLATGCTGYTEYATMSPYYYASSFGPKSLTTFQKINVGTDMTPIWNQNSNYSYDYQLKNEGPKLPALLPKIEQQNQIASLYKQLDNINGKRIYTHVHGQIWLIVLTVMITFLVVTAILFVIYKQMGIKRENIMREPIETIEMKEVDSGRDSAPDRDSKVREINRTLAQSAAIPGGSESTHTQEQQLKMTLC